MVAYLLRKPYDETHFYQHVVVVDFPGELVKVHPAESYLLVSDLYTYLIYYLN